jgi:hypothetical protein
MQSSMLSQEELKSLREAEQELDEELTGLNGNSGR